MSHELSPTEQRIQAVEDHVAGVVAEFDQAGVPLSEEQVTAFRYSRVAFELSAIGQEVMRRNTAQEEAEARDKELVDRYIAETLPRSPDDIIAPEHIRFVARQVGVTPLLAGKVVALLLNHPLREHGITRYADDMDSDLVDALKAQGLNVKKISTRRVVERSIQRGWWFNAENRVTAYKNLRQVSQINRDSEFKTFQSLEEVCRYIDDYIANQGGTAPDTPPDLVNQPAGSRSVS